MEIETLGGGNFEYWNFENGNLDTNLILKISRLVSLKTSDGNFKFIIKNVNFENVVGNLISCIGYVLILLSLQTGFVPQLCVK